MYRYLNNEDNMKLLFALLLLTSVLSECINAIVSCNNNGICTMDKTNCICNKKYTTYKPVNDTECNYERKKQSIAFTMAIIPFFGWFGPAYFYIGNKTLGGVQLFFTLFLIAFVTARCYSVEVDEDDIEMPGYKKIEPLLGRKNNKKAFIILYYACVLTVGFWWIISSMLFCVDFYKDGNGISLHRW